MGGFGRDVRDGRRRRAVRTRQTIVTSFLRLIEEHGRAPTVPELAECSGCSERTVFERFGDLDGVAAAALDEILAHHGSASWPSPVVPRRDRIERHVAVRSEVAERWQLAWRVLERRLDERLQAGVERAFESTRRHLEALYAPELAVAGAENRVHVLVSLEAVLGFSVWGRMRHRHGLSIEEARRTWADAVDRIVPSTLPS